MKLLGGNWFPDHEVHMGEWMKHPKNRIVIDGKQTYQHRKQLAAFGWVKRWRNAIDVGGHVGLWSRHMAQRFEHVYTFEPVAEHRECFVRNCTAKNVTLHGMALGAVPGRVAMWSEPGSSGNTQVRGDGEIEMRTLDSFGFQDVDFIKIDCEGYELYVLQGAVELLKRCKPVLIVEQKPRVIGNFGFKSPEAVAFLESMGATVHQHISGDYMMGWPQ